MYINKIDELVSLIIDDFFNNIILKNKDISKILQEPNFIKYQQLMNNIIVDYSKTINRKQISSLVVNQDNVTSIVEIIKKYVALYLFLYIGFFYKGKPDTFINNTIEFTRNQPSYPLKIENFFNSDSNALIINSYGIVDKVVTVLQADKNKLSLLVKNPDYTDTINFLNEVGNELAENFKLENNNGKKEEQAHNIIKILIITLVYLKYDKKDVHQILDAAEKDQGVYTFIDIVVPRTDYIDFNTIESVLSKKEFESGLAYEIYELIETYEELEQVKDKTPEEKISELINNKILVPIVDDFLLYHKDSEKYEKVVQPESKKKKEDTKIRYIVTKLDSVSDYYSSSVQDKPEVKKNVEKHFYVPLKDRKAVLVNNNEEINIINKLMNQGRKAIENNEYYNDLITYRVYPYINFKNFQKYGFTMNTDQTVDAVRYSTYEIQAKEKIGEEKNLQLRVSSQDLAINIVGFLLPTNIYPIDCLRVKDTYDIRDLGYKSPKGKKTMLTNGFDGILKLLKRTVLTGKKYNPSVYWLFDLKKDRTELKSYEGGKRLDDAEHLKLMLSNLYNSILELMYKKIVKKINKHRSLTIKQFKTIVRDVEKRMIKYSVDSPILNTLQHYAFRKYVKIEPAYDKKEDLFPGLYENVIKLPAAPKPKKDKVPVVIVDMYSLDRKEKRDEVDAPESYGAVCQHNVTWDKISAIRKKNPNEFRKQLYEFVLQYVIPNYEGDFICKSCGTQIDIKNYVEDGTYDGDGRFITLSTPMLVDIEDIPEYEKYKPIIRNMDKLTERLGSVSNVRFLIEKTIRQKNPIKSRIIKDSLDLILINNNILKEKYRERTQRIDQLYGLNKDLSNLFVFDMDPNIFVYSSKDKDTYKFIKRNNILAYLVFLTLLEFNDSQIIYLIGDKLCNYFIFAKYGYPMFSGIKIIKNSGNTVVPIQNYKVLCFLIFYFSCLITKYNMWYTDVSGADELPEKAKKFDPAIQRIVIHTLVDIINSVLEIYVNKKSDDFIYEIVSIKFFRHLDTTFKNNTILYKIKELEEKKTVVEGEKKKLRITKIKSIPLSLKFNEIKYLDISNWAICNNVRFYIPLRQIEYPKYYNINNVTNCESGTFHKWKLKGKTMECDRCNLLLNKIKFDVAKTDKVVANYRYADNPLFSTPVEYGIKCDICTQILKKRAKLDRKQFDEKEKKRIEDQRNKDDKVKNNISRKRDRYEKRVDRYRKTIKELKGRYGKSKYHHEDYYRHVDNFIRHLDSIIGENRNINGDNIYTKYDTYIIDHDHNGFPATRTIVISEKDHKIHYRKNHPFFKQDVIFYTNQQLQVDVFYNSTTLLLIGFKERNRDFSFSKRQNVYMKTNYSIANMLKMLGYPYKYIEMSDRIETIRNRYNMKDAQKVLNHFISDINSKRIINLKKSMTDIQKYIQMIMRDFQKEYEDKDMEVEGIEFMKKYTEKFKRLNIKGKDGTVFMNWKAFYTQLFFKDLGDKPINIDVNDKYVTTSTLSDYDYHGNLILYYMVDQLNKLLSYNNEKHIKGTLVYFIIDVIINIHNFFNEEEYIKNYEIKRFNYVITGKEYLYDVEASGHGLEGDTQGFYEEHVDPDDEIDKEKIKENETAKEEFDSIDVEGGIDGEDGIDYEIDYEPGANLQ